MIETDSPISESTTTIDGLKIGYCKYGRGPNAVLCICGAVGKLAPELYKKDWPSSILQHFDPELVTIVCIDPPGYGTSRPPDRVQEVNRCMKDAGFCLKLMEVNKMILLAAGSKVNKLGAMAFSGLCLLPILLQ
ncbi:hypothetical protein ANCCEY_12225 [Ancylostoma ceylanicum]|uniref:AB hydrolase-1 domain-containing protein n=1 Tax=Ancylostoma ceylanicum TaxID=53326 RepID=A0A0D6LBN8_9BILA|nr:hypothetical protein ANCCEY_12225 [Ancylostoma ceylanicum]